MVKKQCYDRSCVRRIAIDRSFVASRSVLRSSHRDRSFVRRIAIDRSFVASRSVLLVGGGVAAHISGSEPEAFVCDGSWPSDHLPLAWSADMAIRAVSARQRESWQRGIAWHDVLPHHVRQFNSCFQNQLREAASGRRWQMAVVESALIKAGRSALPRTRAPPARPAAAALATVPPPLFDTLEARQHVEAAAVKHGSGNAGKLSRAATEARRMVLAKFSKVDPDPSSAWRFVRTFFGLGNNSALKPPLDTEDPNRKVTAAQDRCEVLGRLYAQVHSDPPSSPVKAQEELAAIEIPAPDRRPHTHVRSPSRTPSANSVSVTELRACFSNFQTGKASDFMGIKVEHLRLLDDASLTAMLPFFDRCITRAALPSHWCTAFVTPIPKPKRDLTIRRNWRPVSVTALLCRACEAIIHNRVQHRIEQNAGEARRGKSQFGFRRGVGTSLPLAGVSMFIRDGQQQTTKLRTWLAAHDNARRSADDTGTGPERQHDALLVCVDASDAFCRALPAKAVRRLLEMGLVDEARWVKALLTQRTLCVREDGKLSDRFAVERGVPQGSILGPLLWSLVVDDLIAQCEAECRVVSPGCVAIPIIFADDINFVIRGFNPSSMVAKANRLLSIVNRWSLANDIPMAKLQASWLSACQRDRTGMYANWTKRDGEVVLNDAVRCTPGVRPVKILGVTYDSDFSFSTHVDNVIEECTRHKRLLFAMAKSVKADKLMLLYRGLILSRLLYGIEAWYPFIRRADAERLQELHRDCCFAITGCRANSHGESVCYEAGFYKFDAVVRDELVKLGDKLRRYPQPARPDEHAPLFGPEWVVALFRDERMPTAAPRMSACGRVVPVALWPERRFSRRTEHDARDCHMSLRDIGVRLFHGGARRGDPRTFNPALRPPPAAFPYAPTELQVFDTHVKFVTSAPSQRGGAPLIKPDNFETLTWEQKRPFRQANLERIDELVRANPGRTLFIFTDGARREGAPGHESCAGAFVVCSTAAPHAGGDVIYKKQISANPIACIYTAELLSIYEALTWVRQNRTRPDIAQYDRVVLITDSKSALESMQTTWLSRIGDLEQRACRVLFELATMERPLHTTLAFVFSHTGGCHGNELADKLATEALPVIGRRWRDDELWQVDTTRRIQRDLHDKEHEKLDHRCFRSRHAPTNGRRKLVPSERLPTPMSRVDEVLLFRARVGTMPDVGGFLHGDPDPCPICCAAGALGRGGTTMEHLLSCHPEHTLAPSILWSDPTAAVAGLRAIRQVAMDTGRCFVQLATGSSDYQQDAGARAARARQHIYHPQQPHGYLHISG